jgi:multiple sugar transport system substrate-binding protein
MTQGEGAEKQYGIMSHDSNWSQWAVIWQNGGEIFDEAATTCLMDSPEAIEALDYMANFVRSERAPAPQQVRGSGMDRGQLFAAGRVGMMSYGHWGIIYFDDTEEFEWNITTLPKGKENASYLYQAIWSASSTTKEPQLCWDFLKFSISPEWSEKFVIEIGGQSSRIEVAERLATNPPAGTRPALAKVWNAVYRTTPGARPLSHVIELSEVMDTAWNPAMDKLWSGEYTAEQTALEITERANQILQN